MNTPADILHPPALALLFHLFPLGHDVLNAELAGNLLFHLILLGNHQRNLSVILLSQNIVITGGLVKRLNHAGITDSGICACRRYFLIGSLPAAFLLRIVQRGKQAAAAVLGFQLRNHVLNIDFLRISEKHFFGALFPGNRRPGIFELSHFRPGFFLCHRRLYFFKTNRFLIGIYLKVRSGHRLINLRFEKGFRVVLQRYVFFRLRRAIFVLRFRRGFVLLLSRQLQNFFHAFRQFLLKINGIILADIHGFNLNIHLVLWRYFLRIVGKNIFLEAELVVVLILRFIFRRFLDFLLVNGIIGGDKAPRLLHLLILQLLVFA